MGLISVQDPMTRAPLCGGAGVSVCVCALGRGVVVLAQFSNIEILSYALPPSLRFLGCS